VDEMVEITGGTFRQGSPPWVLQWLDESDQPLPQIWFGDETPQVIRTLAPYRIDRHPVTVGEFAAFTRATGYVTEAESRGFGMIYERGWTERTGVSWREPAGPGSGLVGREDHPVVNVSWNDAAAYAQWAGKRLSTEAEWEYAARGGRFRLWPWGNGWDSSRANTAEYHGGPMSTLAQWRAWWARVVDRHGAAPLTTPVGAFSPGGDSVNGCADMAGNVYEWTATRSELYADSAQCDPSIKPAIGNYRVLRGGSWMSFRYQVRCCERMHGDPFGWSSFAVGFRCAQDV
jgi:formylglycine-generating enzyme